MIRQGEIADAQAIARIHVDMWREAYAGIVPASHLDNLSVEKRRRKWEDTLARSPATTSVVTDETGRVVGWVSFGPNRDEDGTGRGEVYGIYLQSACWGRGLGRALMQAAETALASQGFSTFTLWVFELNRRARKFYERAGYRPDETVKQVSIGGAALNEIRYAKSI